MMEVAQFPQLDHPVHGLVFPYGLAIVDRLEHFWITDEEAAIDQPSIYFALFTKALYLAVALFQTQGTVAARLRYCRQGAPIFRGQMRK